MFMLRDFYGARRVTVIGFLFYFVLLHYANLFQTFFLLLPPQFSPCICVARLSRPLEDVFSWLVSSLNQFSLRKCVLDHLSAAQSSSRWLCYTFFARYFSSLLTATLIWRCIVSHPNNHRSFACPYARKKWKTYIFYLLSRADKRMQISFTSDTLWSWKNFVVVLTFLHHTTSVVFTRNFLRVLFLDAKILLVSANDFLIVA